LHDRRRDGGTNSTLRIKEEGTHLTFNKHDDDDDNVRTMYIICTYNAHIRYI